MSALAAIFLVAHGLVHLAVWLPPAARDAPFDPRRSWLLGEARTLTRTLATLACAIFMLAGVLVLPGTGVGGAVAVAGAALSLLLILLTFNRWLTGAVAIDVAIVLVVLV